MALWKQGGTGYTVSDSGLFFARVPIEKSEMSLVIGPFAMNFLSEAYVRQVISEYAITSTPPEVVADYLHSIGSGQLKKDIYDGEFHTFGLLRTDQEYVFYIDGRRTWKANARMCEPCPLPGFMELTVEAAEWAGAGSSASVKALPADMLVDYVRVYSAKP